MTFPPILLFAYKRPEHLRVTLETLKLNHGANHHPLYIFCDGAKLAADQPAVEAVRAIARAATGFKNISLVNSVENKGLANSMILGVSKAVREHGAVIVLEDDMVTSPYFLLYMREGLECYEHDTRVFSIHGYNYPADFDQVTSESFFKRGADCWGWATWSRAWQYFDPDASRLLAELKSRNLVKEFDYGGAYPFSTMLKRQAKGAIDSWAIRWHASIFLCGGLTLNPKCSLVQNIGLDGSGVHCMESTFFHTDLPGKKISVKCGEVKNNHEAYLAIANYLGNQPGSNYSLKRLIRRLGRLVGRAT